MSETASTAPERPGGLKRVRSRSSSVNKIPSSQPGRLPRQNDRAVSGEGASGSAASRGRRPPMTGSTIDKLKWYAREHTWFGPLLVILATFALYALQPTDDNPVSAAIYPSYRTVTRSGKLGLGPVEVKYGKGYRDLAFISFYVIVFTFTREFCMQCILQPLARFHGLRSGKVQRFMEQGYTIMYFSCSASIGIWVMRQTPIWYFQTRQFYEGYPHVLHALEFKVYYLCQAAYWLQQFVVLALQLEKPRKDYHELIVHHVVTLLLIGLSYVFHFTRIGLAVFITMDTSDVFLAASKNLNYINSPLTMPFFGSFVIIWFYTRHWLSIKILYSVLTEFETVGPWEIDWNRGLYKCWISQYVCFGLLLAIQLLNCYWFFLILRILYRAVFENEKKDDRSDEDDDDDDEVRADEPAAAPDAGAPASKAATEKKKER